jgi:quercetin dioxygenase-like cupin family protein
MKRIVGALGLTLSEFFSMAESDDPGPRYHYPVDQLINLSPAEGVSLMALPSRQTERKLQVLYETYAPGAGTGREPLVHSGEDAGFCLSGKMELTIDGRTIIIGPGEAFHYPSDRPHSWRNIGKTKATLATACTPPSF